MARHETTPDELTVIRRALHALGAVAACAATQGHRMPSEVVCDIRDDLDAVEAYAAGRFLGDATTKHLARRIRSLLDELDGSASRGG